MRYALIAALALCGVAAQALPQKTEKRKIPCKTPENAASCYWTRGRLAVYDGRPPLRLWKIGTKRVLAIYSGPSIKRGDEKDILNPELPPNVEKVFTSSYDRIFGDFEVCPLGADRPGQMQAACIESAQKLFVQK
jgi:hypothetical protein